jgi:ankyrin repeat protein
MKKSIVYAAVALLTLSTVGMEANSLSSNVIPRTSHIKTTFTPLCVAIQKGELELVKKFIEYGADVNEKSNGLTPLMVAARYNKVEIIKYLLAHGANVCTKDEKGFTALKYAELSLANEAVLLLKQA